jgi:hypothetical protein
MSQKDIRAETPGKEPTLVAHLRELDNVGAPERKVVEDHA